jgi:glycosyltransferase involved in cell wall biosynthesis
MSQKQLNPASESSELRDNDTRGRMKDSMFSWPANAGSVTLACVLITPARNEVLLIEETIKAVVAQTVRPVRWVIVSDGSTDGTDEIVKRYAAEHDWIELVSLPERKERHFAGKVNAFNAGYARLRDINYDVIGNLDADVTFDEEYLAFLLNKFFENPALGVAGKDGNNMIIASPALSTFLVLANCFAGNVLKISGDTGRSRWVELIWLRCSLPG